MTGDRSQPAPVSFHFECTAAGWQHFRSEDWGACRRLIEVSDDQWASRQIDFYGGGQVLVYDRGRRRDEWGMLIGLRFSQKEKWQKHFDDVRQLSASEFDRAWRAAIESRARGDR